MDLDQQLRPVRFHSDSVPANAQRTPSPTSLARTDTHLQQSDLPQTHAPTRLPHSVDPALHDARLHFSCRSVLECPMKSNHFHPVLASPARELASTQLCHWEYARVRPGNRGALGNNDNLPPEYWFGMSRACAHL